MKSLGLVYLKKNNSPQIPMKIKHHHPLIKDLEVDENGKIITEQLGKSYGEFYQYIKTDKKQNKIYIYNITKDGCLDSIAEQDINGRIISSTFYNEQNKPDMSIKSVENGEERTFFDNNGNIKQHVYLDNDGNIIGEEIYSGGQIAFRDKNSQVQNYLVQDIIKDLDYKNFLGIPEYNPKLTTDILNRVDEKTAKILISGYIDETDEYLCDVIRNNVAIPHNVKNQLISHIEKMYVNGSQPEESGAFVAALLFDDINGLCSGRLKEHLKLITPENIKYILLEYKEIQQQEQLDKQAEKFSKEIGKPLKEPMQLKPFEGLLTAIQGEFGLSPKTREKLISDIIDTAINFEYESTAKQTKSDIEEHKNDYGKIEIDIMRSANRIYRKEESVGEDGVKYENKAINAAQLFLLYK